MKLTRANIKDVIYLITLIGTLSGWYTTAKITKHKNEIHEEAQDAVIAAQATELKELRIQVAKNKDYAEENANNVDWLTTLAGLDSN